MNYFLQGFSAFLGVISGLTVNIITQYLIKKSNEKNKVKNLKFEFELNTKKITKWIEEISKYRNALNSDTMDMYPGYFDLSRFVSATANEMFANGMLYKYLSHEDIGNIQIIYGEFTPPWENIINNEIRLNKEQYKSIKMDGLNPKDLNDFKIKVTQSLTFWEGKFIGHKKTIEEILNKLNKR